MAKTEYVLWHYTPSLAGGVIGAIVFLVLTGAHIFRLIRNRTWFCIPFVVGGLFEAIGYAGRAAAHSDTTSKGPYIVQSVLILIAPILFAASIYMVLGRLMLRTDSGSMSIIRPNWVTKIFVISDILCFFIQSGGAGMLTQAKDDAGVKRGERIILGGLMLQILAFGFFVIVAAVWHKRLASNETAAARSGVIPWKKYAYLLYAASMCITIRNACRVVEYAMGRDGFLITHEWTLYMYDCALMINTLAICLVWYNPNIKHSRNSDVEFGSVGIHTQRK
ncbi:RTA1 like protein [Amniculicola lignicola CBS 123094]|uniref:RTA1 like protein n=1 Tax=Amniculicola lignicola CBS 123094 TaxID=1392246 RepID=A0A6A5W0Z7_9PLEO|nr:RTA1 like protein [Amniculicola lignicola CBS 123094]